MVGIAIKHSPKAGFKTIPEGALNLRHPMDIKKSVDHFVKASLKMTIKKWKIKIFNHFFFQFYGHISKLLNICLRSYNKRNIVSVFFGRHKFMDMISLLGLTMPSKCHFLSCLGRCWFLDNHHYGLYTDWSYLINLYTQNIWL